VASGQGEQTRQRILASAVAIVEAEGPRGLKIQRVARAAGVSAPLIYLYFESRAGLVDAAQSVIARQVSATPKKRSGRGVLIQGTPGQPKGTGPAVAPSRSEVADRVMVPPPSSTPTRGGLETTQWEARIRSACDRAGIDLVELGSLMSPPRSLDAIRSWFTGRTTISLHTIAELARILALHPSTQLMDLGIVDDGFSLMPIEVARLTHRVESMSHRYPQERQDSLFGALLLRCVADGRWRVRLEPRYLGSEEYGFHASDILEIEPRAESNYGPGEFEVTVRATLGADLSALGAQMMSSAARETDRPRLVYEIPRLTALSGPSVPLPAAPADLMVIGMDHSTGAIQVGALLAAALGYGSISVSAIRKMRFAAEEFGEDSYEVAQGDAAILRRYLESPVLSERRLHMVLAHTGESIASVQPLVERLRTDDADIPALPKLILLAPTDRLIDAEVRRHGDPVWADECHSRLAHLRDALAASRHTYLEVEVDKPDIDNGHADGGVDSDSYESAILDRSMAIATRILFGLDLLDKWQRLDSAVHEIRWGGDHRCPPGFCRFLAASSINRAGTLILPGRN